MPERSDGDSRLAEAMNARRLDLNLRWDQVAERAGISAEALRMMRRTGSVPRELTQRGIERALGWEAGSVRLVLDGGDPAVAAMGSPGKDAPLEPECEFERRLLARLAREMPDLPDDAKRIMLQAHRDIGHDDSCQSPAQDGQLEAGLAARSA